VHVSPRSSHLQVVFAVEFGDVFGGLALDDISVIDGPCESCMFTLRCMVICSCLQRQVNR